MANRYHSICIISKCCCLGVLYSWVSICGIFDILLNEAVRPVEGDVDFISKYSIQISLWPLAVVVLNAKLNRPCGSHRGIHVAPSYAPVQVKYAENVSVVLFPKQILISFFHTHICPRTLWSGQFVVRTKNDTHFHLHRLIVYYYKMLKDSNEKKIKLLKEQISMVSIMHSLIQVSQFFVLQ